MFDIVRDFSRDSYKTVALLVGGLLRDFSDGDSVR